MTPLQGTVLTVSTRALLGACAALGIEPEVLVAGTDLDLVVIHDPDGRIRPEASLKLWMRAYEITQDPDLAVHVAEAMPPGAYRVMDYLCANAPTIGQAFEGISTYFPWIDSAVTLPITTTSDGHRALSVRLQTSPAATPRPAIEFLFAACFLRIRAAARIDFTPLRIDFAGEAPDDTSELERVFGCVFRFEQPDNRLVIADEDWRRPIENADPVLHHLLQAHAQELVGRVPDRFSEANAEPSVLRDVRKTILSRLGRRPSTLETIAKALAVSTRTLQRRLSEAGVSFNDLREKTWHQAARDFLGEDISISEITYLLGFSEPSSFNRAFKRWEGTPPAEYRRRLSLGDRALR